MKCYVPMILLRAFFRNRQSNFRIIEAGLLKSETNIFYHPFYSKVYCIVQLAS